MAMLPLLKNTVLMAVAIISIHQIFAVWGIDMSAILAAAGILGLAIGMAAKDMLSDVIAGILIMTDQPYSTGQIIELESGPRGMVMAVGLRSTRILTKDNIELIIPNSNMGSTEITNESSAEKEGIRLKLLISTAAGVDIDYIRPMLIDILNLQENLMAASLNKVILADFNDQMTTFCLMFWVSDPGLRGSVPAKIREDVYSKFLQEDVPLASPAESEIIIKSLPNLFGQNPPRQIR
jgi:small-conductance mechanosensitive channel